MSVKTKTKHTKFGELNYGEYASLMAALACKDFLTIDEATVFLISVERVCSASCRCRKHRSSS